MAKTDVSNSAQPAPTVATGPGVVSSGWLAQQSTFEHKDERHFGPAMTSSLILHVGFFLLAVFAITQGPQRVIPTPPPPTYEVVFLEQPGPGGGGGGSPEPAPPKPLEIPESPPEPTPIEVEPVEIPPPPIPTLNAPVQTNAAQVMQASGVSTVSLASYGGGGRGGGIGSGTGSGVGPGEGGGFGGGAYAPGNGVEYPTLIRKADPKYTSEAMRAKLQGEVHLEAVIEPNGSVGDVRVIKSLDRTFGLDQEALKAARLWFFSPCKRQGEPVACKVTLVLEFRLH